MINDSKDFYSDDPVEQRIFEILPNYGVKKLRKGGFKICEAIKREDGLIVKFEVNLKFAIKENFGLTFCTEGHICSVSISSKKMSICVCITDEI